MRLFKFIFVSILCIILLNGCLKYDITTDVDSEEEILAIMEESGKYKFYDDINVQDLSGLFCNVTEVEENSEIENDSEDINVNEDVFSSESVLVNQQQGIEYVLNTSSKKFHLPSCSSASKILDKNLLKQYGRDSIISAGYVPCKVCKP